MIPQQNSQPASQPEATRRRGGRLLALLAAIRDGWLIIGITLLLFLSLEFAYWSYRTLGGLLKGRPQSSDLARHHPYAGMPWHTEEYKEGIKQRPNAFDIYRGFWPRQVVSRYVNSDSEARRVTTQPTFDSATALRIFMFGGSTMWGNASRDSFTIPSQVAARLASRGIRNVEIVNYGQRGYNTTQEAITLLYELARGNTPDLAIFFNGYNDASIALREGRVGSAFGEDAGQQLIDLGNRGFWSELFGLGRHAALVQRLGDFVRPSEATSRRTMGDSICPRVASYYQRIAQSVQAIGEAHGVRTLYFMQPLHLLTRKPLTVWEESLWNRSLLPESDLKQCMLAIDSAMQDRRGKTYFRSYDIFDHDTATVFVDAHSHITERANGIVADQIAEVIVPLLPAPPEP